MIGEGRVAVPSHFFKVVLTGHGGRQAMYAAIVPNGLARGARWQEFLTTVERRGGLDFFHALPDEEGDLLEARLHPLP